MTAFYLNPRPNALGGAKAISYQPTHRTEASRMFLPSSLTEALHAHLAGNWAAASVGYRQSASQATDEEGYERPLLQAVLEIQRGTADAEWADRLVSSLERVTASDSDRLAAVLTDLRPPTDFIAAMGKVAETLARHGVLPAATTAYRALRPLVEEDDVEVDYALGRLLQEQGDLPSAVECFRSVIGRRRNRIEAHMRHVAALSMMGRLDQAVAWYETEVARHPDWQMPHLILGMLNKRLGRYAQAQSLMGLDFWLKSRFTRDFDDRVAPEFGLDRLGMRFVSTNMVRGIGVMCMIDTYVKAEILGRKPSYKKILLAPRHLISNKCMLEYWEKYLTVVYDDVTIHELSPLEAYLEDRVDWEVMLDGEPVYIENAMGIVQHQWEEENRPPLFSITPDHARRARRALASLGVPEDAWFVALHVREDGYVRERGGAVESDAYRNASILDYEPAVDAILARGGWVIRVGDSTMRPFPERRGVIDYAHSPLKSDWMDIFLAGACRFYLGTNSGLCLVPLMFGVPAALTNWSWSRAPRSRRDLYMPKLYREKDSDRLPTLAESMRPDLVTADGVTMARLGIETVDNRPDEIRALVEEMFERLTGSDREDAGDRDVQERLITQAVLHNPDFQPNSRLGRFFLSRYQGILLSD